MVYDPAVRENDGNTFDNAGNIRCLPTTFGKKNIHTTNNARITGEINIPIGASNNFRSYVSPLYFPKNALKTIIIQYTKVSTLADHATTGINVPQLLNEQISNFDMFNSEVKNISLLKNPLHGGQPAIEKLPIIATVNETGIMANNPPNRRPSPVHTR